MSAREQVSLTPPARRSGEPTFDEPWQAEALALAFALCERGLFSAGMWSEALGAELRRAEASGAPDDHETYYKAVLAALERLVEQAGSISGPALAHRVEQWRRAYLQTPHGQPVELAAGSETHR